MWWVVAGFLRGRAQTAICHQTWGLWLLVLIKIRSNQDFSSLITLTIFQVLKSQGAWDPCSSSQKDILYSAGRGTWGQQAGKKRRRQHKRRRGRRRELRGRGHSKALGYSGKAVCLTGWRWNLFCIRQDDLGSTMKMEGNNSPEV